jgi:DNA-binding FadR family transcriptional regulator
MRRVTVRRATAATADILREEILSKESDGDEWLLGSEDDIISMLGVSRPTLRQAARVLESEQLLVVRGGIGGGLFGRRPTATAVSHIASVYLRSHGATYRDLITTQKMLSVECARLAACNPDDDARKDLLRFYEDRIPDEAHVSTKDFMHHTIDWQREVAELAGSPALSLFVNVLMDLSEGSAPVARVYSNPDRQRQTLRRHNGIAQAIAAGDPALAAERMTQHLDIILSDQTTSYERLTLLRRD